MNKIRISGTLFYSEDFSTSIIPQYFTVCSKRNKLYHFLREWFSPSETISLYTSGSTGKPKEIVVRKSQMLQSAAMTCGFFNLNKEHKALLCLSTDYIAGKMMVVRAIYCGMDLYPVEVTGNPLFNTSTIFDFAAMVPLQVYNSIANSIERSRLSKIKNLIIGGGPINRELEDSLRNYPNSIYSSYGMTETLSHIGLRKINGEDASLYYKPLFGVDLSVSDNKTLIINAPHLIDTTLATNDIAEIRADGSFKVVGRIDNIINTGGIKVQAEVVEQQLHQYIKCEFAVTSIPHPKLGEAIVLLIESLSDQNRFAEIITEINKILPRHQQPQYIFEVDKIPYTINGKPDRANTKLIAKEKAKESIDS